MALNWDSFIEIEDLFSAYDRVFKHIRENEVILLLDEKAGCVDAERPIMRARQQFFSPSLQYQRNSFTFEQILDVSRNTSVKTLAILGCGELSLEAYLMHSIRDSNVDRIVSVDVDEKSLSRGLERMKESLDREQKTFANRNALLVVLDVYKGDVTEPSSSFCDVDVPCAIEVIEHMPLEVSTKLLLNVLHSIRPKTFILSTPNMEFNIVFGNSKFRHEDHHFEFTRAEFRDWLQKNVPADYSFRIEFVSRLLGHADLSGATQFAVISRKTEAKTLCSLSSPPLQKVASFILRNGWTRMMKFLTINAFLNFLGTATENGIEGYPCYEDAYIHVPTEKIFALRPSNSANFAISLDSFTDMLCEVCHPYVFQVSKERREDEAENEEKREPVVAVPTRELPAAIRGISYIYNNLD